MVVLGGGRGACWSGRRLVALRNRGGGAGCHQLCRPARSTTSRRFCHSGVYALLGLVLAAGLRLRAAAASGSSSSPTPSTCCCLVAARAATRSASGRFPIVFSTNLFLWFRDDWFYLQFLLVAVGFLGKAFVRWERDGRRVHIFNPSAFTLALFSLVLLATGTTGITWGQEIDTTFSLGPRIYLVLFLDRPGRHVLLRDHAGDGRGRGGDAVRRRARSTWR